MKLDSVQAPASDLTGRADAREPGILPDAGPWATPGRSGIFPDLREGPAPIELPRVVMRGALAVALGGLVLALVLGLWRARGDMRDELDGAVAMARAMALLAEQGSVAPPRDTLLDALQAIRADGGLRHLRLQLLDAGGRPLLDEADDPPAPAPLAWLIALNRLVFTPPPPQVVSWPLPRPDGEVWTLQLQASPSSEQREALETLLELLGLLAVASGVMLAVMAWRVRRSFRPLRPLLDAIARVERQELSPLKSLPAMPIGELEAIAGALRHLAAALEQAEGARRALSRQVLTLQEEERGRLARELHDELGQHLTALRVDAAWLQRRLADAGPEIASVAAGMGAQCERLQQEVRALLTRLRPPGHATALDEAGGETVERLQALLANLVQAWAHSPGSRTRFLLDFAHDGIDAAQRLPGELVLTVYRISQEALTNVARHAEAGAAGLTVRIEAGPGGGVLHWRVEDDGRGLDHPAAWRRGNGLAGVKERIWAAGGDLDWGPADAAAARPGLRLQARLAFAIDDDEGGAR